MQSCVLEHTIHGILFNGWRLHTDEHLALEGLKVWVHGKRYVEGIREELLRGDLQGAGAVAAAHVYGTV